MSEIDLNVDVGQTKTLTFNTKDKYNSEDIVFNIAANDTLAAWAKAATKPSYTWSEINGKPTFATVATSGSYNDLSNKPSLNYLPLTGGTMTGAIDMNKNPLNNAGFEVVTDLPTTNLFVGRKVVMNGIEYTYNGVKFIANGINTIDNQMGIRNLTQLTPDEISYNDIIYNEPYIYASSFNSTLESFTPEVVETYTDNSWQTISFPNRVYSDTPVRFTMFKNSVSGRKLGSMSSIFMWTRDWIRNVHIKIEYQSYNTDTQTYDWFIVKELDFIGKTCIIPLPVKTLYPSQSDGNNKGLYYIDNARITISFLNSNSQELQEIAIRALKFNTTGIIPLTDVKFDINYDAIIKPTQTGNTVTKTNKWVLQYLTQGVNWLRDNKVETNSDATLRTLNIKGGANSTAILTSTESNEFYIQLGGKIPFLLYPTVVRPGMLYTNEVELGDTNSYWKSVRAGKYIVHGGTSSQFLKADGSVDSNSYATLDSTGKVPTSQLPSYVDDVEEYTNRASFPATGEKGKIYVDVTENDIYRWTGSTYIKISGIIGAQGEKGAQGFQGIKGTDGTNGTTGAQGYRGYQGYTGLQGATGLQGKNGTNGKYGTNFAGCFISSYSLYDNDQCDVGTVYTFNKADFNLNTVNLNTGIADGDTILVIYQPFQENITFVEHCYIKLTRFISNESTFNGVVQNWFKLSDGLDGVQGYRGYQGYTGIQGKQGLQGKNGTNGVQGYRGYQGIQGISGALATNHWYLDKANTEVTGSNNTSKLIQLDTINDSIFAKLSNLPNGSLNGRSFIVDCSDTDGSATINDLFGDFSKYNVPNQVRYHFYIRNSSKRQNSMKIEWNPEFYTNVSHRPGFTPDIALNYGECCKIEFVKFDDSHAWVDVELEDLIYDASTSAASENNEDNAMSQIQAYCENNKLSYTLNKESHDIQFNLIDIIADICSKLK